MKLAVRQWHFCRGIRCTNLKESHYVGVPRECTLEACQYPDKDAVLAGLLTEAKGRLGGVR